MDFMAKRRSTVESELRRRISDIGNIELPFHFNFMEPLIFLCIKPIMEIERVDYDELDGIFFNPIDGDSRERQSEGDFVYRFCAPFDEEQRVYAFLSRDGYFETSNNRIFINVNYEVFIHESYYEDATVRSLREYINMFRNNAISPPFLLFFGLFNIRGLEYRIRSNNRNLIALGTVSEFNIFSDPIDINDCEPDIRKLLEPTFNRVRQSVRRVK